MSGPYPNLREFLVAVENLNVIAIATELKLQTGEAGSTAMPGQAPPRVITTMTLVLSTYDRPGLDPARPMGLQAAGVAGLRRTQP